MENQFGFTIVELLITVVIAGVLFGVALPYFRIFVKNSCLTTSDYLLVSNFQIAWSEAIKHRSLQPYRT